MQESLKTWECVQSLCTSSTTETIDFFRRDPNVTIRSNQINNYLNLKIRKLNNYLLINGQAKKIAMMSFFAENDKILKFKTLSKEEQLNSIYLGAHLLEIAQDKFIKLKKMRIK